MMRLTGQWWSGRSKVGPKIKAKLGGQRKGKGHGMHALEKGNDLTKLLRKRKGEEIMRRSKANLKCE